MSDFNLPLLELFMRLQRAGLPLGIDEYLAALAALRADFGLVDVNALQRLCRILWVKSAEEERVFTYHFEQLRRQAFAHHRSPEVWGIVFAAPEQALSQASLRSERVTTSALAIRMEDEIEIAQAIQSLKAKPTEDDNEGDVKRRSFDLEEDESIEDTPDIYTPLTRRQMKQRWRYLRHSRYSGPSMELDIEATLHNVESSGLLLAPVVTHVRRSKPELLVLVDQKGSMNPFQMLSVRLVETLVASGQLGNVKVYYFHNVPDPYLYCDSDLKKPEDIGTIVARRTSRQMSVLVFSDAGAARGTLNLKRVSSTKALQLHFQHCFRSFVWLNPVPSSRWSGTTAASLVRQGVPMFDLSRKGVDMAIDVLRGRSLHSEQRRWNSYG